MGIKPLDPPSVEASRIEAMRDLWTGAASKRSKHGR
jgi:hypothetical protein